MLLVGLGIVTSLPIVVWGSGVLARLMNRQVWIIWLGGGILGYVAGEMILSDQSLARFVDPDLRGLALLPLAPAGAVAALGWWLARNGRKRLPRSI